MTSVPCSTKERSKESTTTKIIPNRKPSRMTPPRNLVKSSLIWDFLEDCPELIALDTGNCVYESVVRTVRTSVRTIAEIGAR